MDGTEFIFSSLFLHKSWTEHLHAADHAKSYDYCLQSCSHNEMRHRLDSDVVLRDFQYDDGDIVRSPALIGKAYQPITGFLRA